MFWNLFQAACSDGFALMTTSAIFYIAIAVFGLLVTGLYLTAREFYRITEEPSVRKDYGAVSDKADPE